MQIIKDKNNVVTHAGEGFSLTESGMYGPGFKSPRVTTKTHTLEEVETVPADFRGGHFSYDKAWAQIKDIPEPEPDPREAAMKELAQAKAEQEGKAMSMAYLDKRMTAIEKILGI